MKLFIANLTRGPYRVTFRLDVIPPGQVTRNRLLPKHQDIPSGQQRRIGGDMVIGQIEEIVDGLTKHGMIGEVDVAQIGKRSGFVPLIFQLDKAVSPRSIRLVHEHNMELLTRVGHERRRRAALAANAVIEDKLAELGESVTELDVGFEQLEVSEAEEKRIDEGFRVRPDGAGGGDTPPPTKKTSSRRGRPSLKKAA